MTALTEYEVQRQKNIAANLAILASLGLEKPSPAVFKSTVAKHPKPRPKYEPKVLPKRKTAEAVTVKEEPETGKRRKSARLVAAVEREAYKDAQVSCSDSDSPVDMPDLIGVNEEYNDGDRPGLPRRVVNGRFVAHIDPTWERPNPKVFGPIEGVHIGSWWAMRQEVSLAGVHGPWVAGISGSSSEGAYSVALSGGYEDDIDEGFRFTFTGAGGRELKKDNLRTAPQSKNQILSRGNAALVKSYETGKPVRVVRGYKGNTQWAPRSGYRYDGLYMVAKWWVDVGMAGYKVYRFAFKRMDGQEPINLNAGPPGESDYEEEEEEEEEQKEEKKEKKEKKETKLVKLPPTSEDVVCLSDVQPILGSEAAAIDVDSAEVGDLQHKRSWGRGDRRGGGSAGKGKGKGKGRKRE